MSARNAPSKIGAVGLDLDLDAKWPESFLYQIHRMDHRVKKRHVEQADRPTVG